MPRPMKAIAGPTCFDGCLMPVARALMIVLPPSTPSRPATTVLVIEKCLMPRRRREQYAISVTLIAVPMTRVSKVENVTGQVNQVRSSPEARGPAEQHPDQRIGAVGPQSRAQVPQRRGGPAGLQRAVVVKEAMPGHRRLLHVAAGKLHLGEPGQDDRAGPALRGGPVPGRCRQGSDGWLSVTEQCAHERLLVDRKR